MNNKKIILDLCGGTGSWGKPYEDAGYDVILITLPNYDIRLTEVSDEFITFKGIHPHDGLCVVRKSSILGILAAPPCTEFSIAKNHNIPRDISAGMELVSWAMNIIDSCKNSGLKFWALENPSGLLHKFIGPPKLTFQPWWYGDGWTKKTMIWGNFNLPERQYFKYEDCPQIPGLYVRPGRKTASIAFNHKNHKRFIRQFDPFSVSDDAAFRAITPPGFAKAFFKVNQ